MAVSRDIDCRFLVLRDWIEKCINGENKSVKYNFYQWICINPNATDYILKCYNDLFFDINWENLSNNPNAIPILEANINKIKWNALSANENSIHILEKNLDKVDWNSLSLNPNAIHI